MQYFLDQLSQHLYEVYGHELHNVTLIFPNKRAGLFFKEHLSRHANYALQAPEIINFEEWIRSLSQSFIADRTTILFELYESYKAIGGTDPFDEALMWAEVMLDDFEEADLYLVEPKKLFELMKDIQALEVWGLQLNEMSELYRKFLEHWERMGFIYLGLHERLCKKGLAYFGMAAKDIFFNFKKLHLPNLKDKKIVFAGFNGLNKIEENLIKLLIQEKIAEIYWDVDAFYLDNENREAGYLIRQYIKKWNLPSTDFQWKNNFLDRPSQQIEIIAASDNLTQVKIVSEIITTLSQSKEKKEDNKIDWSDTAIVLPDAGLLFPLLNALPENINDYNVTGGYPLKNTATYSFLYGIIHLQQYAKTTTSTVFYYKSVFQLLSHPFVQSFTFFNEQNENFLERLRNDNQIYVSEKYLQNNFNSIHWLFQHCQSMQSSFDYFDELFKKILQIFEGNEIQYLEREYLLHIYSAYQQLKNSIQLRNFEIDPPTFWKLFKDILHTKLIPFSGEPLKGMQIMGLFETRLLDFKNVIFLSVNENVLPKSDALHSFYPFDVRAQFGLPNYNENDANYAYHFYRLLQRCENAFLIYDDETGKNAGERSRFIEQIILEFEHAKISTASYGYRYRIGATQPSISVEKNEDTINRLNALAETGIAPTALLNYLQCSLKFYFNQLLNLKASEDVEEEMESRTLGLILHYVLENLYKPYIDRNITEKDLENMSNNYHDLLDKAIQEHASGLHFQSGPNYLRKLAIKELINTFLNQEKALAPFKMLGSETRLEKQIILNDGKKILLKGFVDRIHDKDGITTIVDYKTGRISEVKLKTLNDATEFVNQKEAFQLLFYAYLLNENPKYYAPHSRSGIYFFKNLSSGFIDLIIGEGTRISKKINTVDGSHLEMFHEFLTKVLEELYHPETKFIQTDDHDRCAICPYMKICARE